MTAQVKTEPAACNVEGDFGGAVLTAGLKRVRLPENLDAVDKEELLGLWNEQELYVDHLESLLREDVKLKGGPEPASRREHLLVVRLAMKEQENQELLGQIAELKSAQIPSVNSLRNCLVDPAVNLIILNLKKELEATKTKMQETQEELSAWKFTPDSVTGKRLMSKCRQLLQENEEIGKMISSGRLAKLEGELAMQKNLCDEMRKNQAEMDDFVQELDEDVEGMQSTICFLQQQLKEAKETIANLQQQPLSMMPTTTATAVAATTNEPEPEAAEVDKMDEDEPEAEKEPEQGQDGEAKEEEKEVDAPAAIIPAEPEADPAAGDDGDVEKGEEGEDVGARLNRRAQTTPPKTTASKRGRVTRGQKREVEDDGEAAATGSGRGRPKRSRRAAPARGNKDRTKSESENLNEEETAHSDEN